MSRGTFGAILRRYGQPVFLEGAAGKREGRAFVQPILERGGAQTQQVPTPLGRRRADRFLYLGAPDVSVACGDRVECMGSHYRVSCAQMIRIGEKTSHWWAMLRPRDEE